MICGKSKEWLGRNGQSCEIGVLRVVGVEIGAELSGKIFWSEVERNEQVKVKAAFNLSAQAHTVIRACVRVRACVCVRTCPQESVYTKPS